MLVSSSSLLPTNNVLRMLMLVIDTSRDEEVSVVEMKVINSLFCKSVNGGKISESRRFLISIEHCQILFLFIMSSVNSKRSYMFYKV